LATHCFKESYLLKSKHYNLKTMSRVDVFVLAVLFRKNKLSLSNIVEKIAEINLTKPPSRIGMYKRLQILKEQKLVDFEWKQGEKIYIITEKGLETISEFINQLNGAQSA
jgi:DNA-binding PadR family transcriptional regulator